MNVRDVQPPSPNPAWDTEQVVGVLREVKAGERRVALTPDGARVLVGDGRTVLVECGAGDGSGFSDDEYRTAGATVLDSAAQVAAGAGLLLHVKEPQPAEFSLLGPQHTLFTYLHLAAAPDVAAALAASGCRAVAYESVELHGSFPLLAPMSAIAGRLATQLAARGLEAPDGRGVLLGGVPGVEPATVMVIGAGVSGRHAAQVAAGMGAKVLLVDVNRERAEHVARSLGERVTGVGSGPGVIDEHAPQCDVIIGAVLVPGRAAPVVVTAHTLSLLARGAVVVDIAIDQGGCVESVEPTSHAEPFRQMGGVRVSATPNMPAAVPRAATAALTRATLPYVRALAGGWTAAVAQFPELRSARNVEAGAVVHKDVIAALAG